jgi:probable pyridine nucleotide-disulfide oxidoreductase
VQIEEVDLLVIGGGKAGKSLAMDLAREGQKVAMVERGMIGGTCINVACIPTKTLISSGRLLQKMQRAAEFGIDGAAAPKFKLDLLRNRKDEVVSAMSAGNHKQFLESGMDFILGEARFVGRRTVEVALNDGGTRTLRGADVVINTGTVPAVPPIEGLAEAQPLTSDTLLELEQLPESIIVLGGGYIGAEYADLLSTAGVKVTVVEGGSQLLGREDADIAEAVLAGFSRAGIDVRLNASAERISRAADGTVTVELSDGGTIAAAELLTAVGRTPVTAGLGLDVAGVETDERGFVLVDEHLHTSAAGVWAAGDVAGTAQFTHASYDDYRILKENLDADWTGKLRSTADRLIPYTVFTTPELGRVGLTEAQAREAGYDVLIARMPASAIPRARTIGELDGVWKAVVDRATGRILGAALLSAEASEAVTSVQLAMLGGLDYRQVRDAVISHPTMTEGLNLLFTPAFLAE